MPYFSKKMRTFSENVVGNYFLNCPQLFLARLLFSIEEILKKAHVFLKFTHKQKAEKSRTFFRNSHKTKKLKKVWLFSETHKKIKSWKKYDFFQKFTKKQELKKFDKKITWFSLFWREIYNLRARLFTNVQDGGSWK